MNYIIENIDLDESHILFLIERSLYLSDRTFVRKETVYGFVNIKDPLGKQEIEYLEDKMRFKKIQLNTDVYKDHDKNRELIFAALISDKMRNNIESQMKKGEKNIRRIFSPMAEDTRKAMAKSKEILEKSVTYLECSSVIFNLNPTDKVFRTPIFKEGGKYEVLRNNSNEYVILANKYEFIVEKSKMSRNFKIEVSGSNFQGRRVNSNITGEAFFKEGYHG